DLPAVSVEQEFARIRGVAQLDRPAVEHVAGRRIPADRVNLAAERRLAQCLGHAHHHQQVAVGKPGQARVERAENVGFGIEPPREWRAREVDVVRRQDQPIDGKIHSSLTRWVTAICCTTARRGWVSMKCTATAMSSARSIFSWLIISRCSSAGISGYWKS